MKKIAALLLCLCVLAAAVPTAFADPAFFDVSGISSKKANDLKAIYSKMWPSMHIEVYYNGEGTYGVIGIRLANKAVKAAKSTSINSFFNAKTPAGEAADLHEIVGAEDLDIAELDGFGITGYEEAMGDVEVIVKSAVPVNENEKVAVLIGLCGEDAAALAADENAEIDPEWTVFEGKGLEDSNVGFTLPGSYAAQIQEVGGALISIVREAYSEK